MSKSELDEDPPHPLHQRDSSLRKAAKGIVRAANLVSHPLSSSFIYVGSGVTSVATPLSSSMVQVATVVATPLTASVRYLSRPNGLPFQGPLFENLVLPTFEDTFERTPRSGSPPERTPGRPSIRKSASVARWLFRSP